MKPDADLQLIKLYWNRLTYWQKKSIRIHANYYTFNRNAYQVIYFIVLVFFKLVTPMPLTRTRSAHWV